ncbi:MAG: hypothetical protein WD424_08525 [Paenibacillaceae bacterium]
MKDSKKVSELIELHLELKGEARPLNFADDYLDAAFDENTLPPRRYLFPSKKPKLTRIFYNTLFVLFLILVIGLTVWGAKMN